MTTSHKTKWREARMAIKAAHDQMKLPDGKTCADCAHNEHCRWLFGIKGDETECDIYPSRFQDDVMTIYHHDGTQTEVKHPFRALQVLDGKNTEEEITRLVNTRPIEDALQKRIAELEAYADKLAAGFPEGMLPKDIEILREQNWKMAERIDELEAELSTLREAQRFHGMDTAPKDGSFILLTDGEDVEKCQWGKNSGVVSCISDPYEWLISCSYQDEQGGYATMDNPVGWFKLPELPEVEG